MCISPCVCQCICMYWFYIIVYMCRYEVRIIQQQTCVPPLRQRVSFSSFTLWRVSVSLLWCCLVLDKQTHMTDVNMIPTSPAVSLLLPDILLMCRRRREELLRTVIYIQNKPSQTAEGRCSAQKQTELCWRIKNNSLIFVVWPLFL